MRTSAAAPLLAVVFLLAACGQTVDDDAPFDDDAALDDPAAEPGAEAPDAAGDDADDAAAAPDTVGECGMPDFSLTGLPWDGDPADPDTVQAREQVTALVWYSPEGDRSLQLLRGQGQPSRVEPYETAAVRGHEATLWWTGQPGSAPLSAHWAESDNPCDQYMVVLAPAGEVAELTALLPE